ncbi:mobile mystery protein A [Bradyrhizobium sp. CCGUVB23]|uniref:mobile mystery protein A n=1 Tax=Bradyrhizobium sp. CCGUVB23 TaxID=2949630 RepID=UPI0020B42081|nr:mobile mystery protein A [Bradyrhizobium sp. CCGUVB23]MCP3460940.1 mobile mystery protein A [Bradyrhizobium sp. CCGUVB23]
MGIKTIVQQQYRSIVDSAASTLAGLKTPPEGWLRTVRSALGMSGTDVAMKMGVTRARITKAEHAELTGGVTLKSMQTAAEAMGCRFVYAIVPASGRIEDIITTQARKKAMAIVGTASKHMALENQKLPDDKIAQEVERLTREIALEMPPNFWNDK